MAASLRDQIKRESYITNEIIIQQEALKAGELEFRFFLFICNVLKMFPRKKSVESNLKKKTSAEEDPCQKHVNHINASRTTRSSEELGAAHATTKASSECCLTMDG